MRFDLVPDASAAVRKVGQAQTAERRSCGLRKGNIVTQRSDIVEQGVDHLIEDLVRDFGTDEVKDDYVLSDAVQYLGSIEHGFEVLFNFASNFSLHGIESLVGRDVGDALAGRSGCVNPQVGSKYDESLGEVDTVAATGS